MALELAPAVESVLAREQQLRLGQDGRRLCGAQPLQLIFRGLLEPLEAWTWRAVIEASDTFSLVARRPRFSGRKKAMASTCDRRVQPFTRTVGFLESENTIPRAPLG